MTCFLKAILLVAAISLQFAGSVTAQEKGKIMENKTHRVVFELTSESPEQWDSLLNNVENVRKALGEKTQIEVVAHGKGLGALLKTDEKSSQRMEKLSHENVVFGACENTMKRKNVAKEDLLPFTITVDSGVAEVVRKQESGWSYVKSGN